MTRTQLREHTGLAQPTVIELVKRLEEAGLIEESGASEETRPGPRAVLYSLVMGRAFVVAAEVRDKQVFARVADVSGGDPFAVHSRSLVEGSIAAQIVAVVREAIAASPFAGGSPAGVVVGVAGAVERASGDLGFAWDLLEARSGLLLPLTEGLGAPVELINGVHLVALAEGRALQALDTEGAEFALIWIGTGVGMSAIVDGVPFRGRSGAAGQIGYMPVPGAPVVPIKPRRGGFRGDLQGLIGARALRSLAKELGLGGRSISTILSSSSGMVSEELRAEFLDELARRVAVALASVSAVMDPGHFVLHGESGIAGGDALAARAQEYLHAYSPLESHVTAGTIKDVNIAALEGALLMARKSARNLLWGRSDVGSSA